MDKKIEVYTSPTCHFCHSLKDFLNEKEVKFIEYSVSGDPEKTKELVEKSGQLGVPVTIIEGEEPIIGFDKDKLTELLKL